MDAAVRPVLDFVSPGRDEAADLSDFWLRLFSFTALAFPLDSTPAEAGDLDAVTEAFATTDLVTIVLGL